MSNGSPPLGDSKLLGVQTRDAQDEIVPSILQQVKLMRSTDEIWDAWYSALLTAAPQLDRPTADRNVLMYAMSNSTATSANELPTRVRACKLLAVAAKALTGNGEVCRQ
jgi:hypothetical protein